ncbi:tetratricopeptide repeat protein [Hyphomicrobium sp. LHD-15]|uniref:tetratricopeptide repeat protein n=1 Tax=Hyphomicrobium sp. LHD-15 TaxID=3072142 RepID=UPI00280D2060|nr:tetratricopeptide repeat protein [Hyphomicrobium sp. LHD-15]MDQ8700007.1 tetratricopeptide repeat protein [Hyphomicrobium sp. LHD-15]
MKGADVRVDDDFELSVAEGVRFQTLYVRVLEPERDVPSAEIPSEDLRKLAVEGSVDAQIGWARRLLHGHGAEHDPEAALRWFKMAARSGDAEALNMVGRCFELGWGVAPDLVEAADWYRRAANKNHAWGEFNLANLYAQGLGVPYDENAALTLLVRSARRGNAKAMNMIGRYREAKAADRRPGSPFHWYRWAAQRGCFRGQFRHGCHLVTTGRVIDGLSWLRTSFSQAPGHFRQEALDALQQDAHPALREFAREQVLSGGEQGPST